ncbi:MAG TPA: hypothetical protein VMV59_00310 [Candidatus Dormibacteraeota bacterium]|nr:hypothetical protein [Candidatus Dormibacteraeota bacterium]
MPDAGKQSFSVVDFSPDGSRLLLASNPSDERDSGHVEVTTMPLYSGATHWESTWDLFGWKNCDTTVEPQGFMPDGKVIVMARPSIVYGHGQPNCVSHETLYEVDLTSATSKVMPDSLRIKRYGVVTRGPEHTCKTDPDLVAECFVIRGRVRFYNGGPSPRIWKVGTNRMLEVVDEVLPGELDLRMNWNTDAFGNFDFCPFTRGKPGVMQLVCIESARNVTYKKRE